MNLNTCIMIYILAVFVLTGFCFWVSHSGWVFLILILLLGIGDDEEKVRNDNVHSDN